MRSAFSCDECDSSFIVTTIDSDETIQFCPFCAAPLGMETDIDDLNVVEYEEEDEDEDDD